MNLEKLYNVSLPDPIVELQKNEDLRKSYVCASAYITFALEEGGIDHTRNTVASLTTAETHNLNTNQTPEEYLTKAIQELAYVEENTSDSHFAKELSLIRKSIQRILN